MRSEDLFLLVLMRARSDPDMSTSEIIASEFITVPFETFVQLEIELNIAGYPGPFLCRTELPESIRIHFGLRGNNNPVRQRFTK